MYTELFCELILWFGEAKTFIVQRKCTAQSWQYMRKAEVRKLPDWLINIWQIKQDILQEK